MTYPKRQTGTHENDPDGSIFLPEDQGANLNRLRFELLLGRGAAFDLVVAATAYDPAVHPDTEEIMDPEPNLAANRAAEKRIIEAYEVMRLARRAVEQCVEPVAPHLDIH